MSSGLVVDGLVVHRLGSPIVRGIDLVVRPGEISVLLGTNGVGKTTTIEAISGVIPVAEGSIRLHDTDVTNLPRERRARAGLAHVEQGRSVFPDLTVEENLLVAGTKAQYGPVLERFPRLVERSSAKAGLLSGGEQQMLVIARALVNRPDVLMLDEMSLGLAPMIVKQLIPMVADMAAQGVGVLLVEQFAPLALSIGHRAYVMSRGEIVYDGDCRTLLNDLDLLHAMYLGGGEDATGTAQRDDGRSLSDGHRG